MSTVRYSPISSHSAAPRVQLAHQAAATQRGRLHLRLAACWHGAELDRRLAAGADPQSSAVLTVRAQRITGPRSRKRVADGLVRAVRSAEDRRPVFTAAVHPFASEVLSARAVLVAIDRRLRRPELVSPQGVAILRALLTEPASPLYQPSDPGTLASQLRAAAASLGPSDSGDESALPPRGQSALPSRDRSRLLSH